MNIDRCVCTKRPFAELLEEAQNEGLSLIQLAQNTGASTCCTMCGPYLRRCYRTGQTAFTQLLYEDDEPYTSPQDQAPAPHKL